MTEHEQNWRTYYVLEARYKPHDVKWLELATYEHEQPAMEELENRIKKYGDKYDYRVIQRQEAQVSIPKKSPVSQDLNDLRCERDKLRDTLVETLIIYLDMHKRISDSLTEMRDYLTGKDK